MTNLPDDVLFKIFVDLPIKSLLLYRQVSKSWRSLITDPVFTRMQLLHQSQSHPNRIKTLIRSSLRRFHSLDVDYVDPESNQPLAVPLCFPLLKNKSYYVVEIFGSCNGLVTLIINKKHKALEDGSRIVLWNPTIGEYKILPNPCPRINTYEMLGFGYEDLSDDYKVVRINNESRVMDIYSLRTDSWEILGHVNVCMASIRNLRGRFVKGCIYWLINCTSVQGDIKLIGYRLRDHKFVEPALSLYSDMDKKQGSVNLIETGGCLWVYQQSLKPKSELSMWPVLSSREDERFRLLKVKFYKDGTLSRPLFFRTRNKGVFLVEQYNQEKRFIYFSTEKVGVTFPLIVSVQGITSSLEEIEYIESLVSPNSF